MYGSVLPPQISLKFPPPALLPALPPYLNVARLIHEAHVAELLQLRGVVRGGICDGHGGGSLGEGGRGGGREGEGLCQYLKLLDGHDGVHARRRDEKKTHARRREEEKKGGKEGK